MGYPAPQEKGMSEKEVTPEQFKEIVESISFLEEGMRDTVGDAGGIRNEKKLIELARVWMQLKTLSGEANSLLDEKKPEQATLRDIEEQYTLLRKAIQELLPELFKLKPSQSKMVH